MFLMAALVTVGVAFLIVRRMANQLNQGSATERRIPSIFLDLPRIVREHNRLFPRSSPMLAFWLSLEFLLIWLACMVMSLAINF
jgi:hypothetical protein